MPAQPATMSAAGTTAVSATGDHPAPSRVRVHIYNAPLATAQDGLPQGWQPDRAGMPPGWQPT
jgi:hypothetical protein